MKRLFYVLLIIPLLFSCSSDDEQKEKTKEEIEKEYIERSKERLKPFLAKWILEKEIHPFEKFVLFNYPIDNSFRSIEFEIKRYVPMGELNFSDKMTVYHIGNMRYVYNDRVNMVANHPIDVEERTIDDKSDEYEIYFKFRIFYNKNTYRMTLLNENTLELSYVDKRTQKKMSLNFMRTKSDYLIP